MELNLANKKYYVKFYHFPAGEYGKEYGRGTRAELLGSSESKFAIANEKALCNPNDNFVRKTGRKLAFKRLLDFMQSQGIISSREERKLCWDTYFENFKKGK